MLIETLKEPARRALADADPNGPGGVRMQAVKLLRERDGKLHTMSNYLAAVQWAVERTAPTLTRAAKERAVAELADRLSGVSENAAYADAEFGPLKRGDVRWFHRREYLLRKAIVRVAMARTVD